MQVNLNIFGDVFLVYDDEKDAKKVNVIRKQNWSVIDDSHTHAHTRSHRENHISTNKCPCLFHRHDIGDTTADYNTIQKKNINSKFHFDADERPPIINVVVFFHSPYMQNNTVQQKF